MNSSDQLAPFPPLPGEKPAAGDATASETPLTAAEIGELRALLEQVRSGNGPYSALNSVVGASSPGASSHGASSPGVAALEASFRETAAPGAALHGASAPDAAAHGLPGHPGHHAAGERSAAPAPGSLAPFPAGPQSSAASGAPHGDADPFGVPPVPLAGERPVDVFGVPPVPAPGGAGAPGPWGSPASQVSSISPTSPASPGSPGAPLAAGGTPALHGVATPPPPDFPDLLWRSLDVGSAAQHGEGEAVKTFRELAGRLEDPAAAARVISAVAGLVPMREFLRHGTPEQKLFTLNCLGDRFLNRLSGVRVPVRRELLKAAAKYLTECAENFTFLAMESEPYNNQYHERVDGASASGRTIKEQRGFVVTRRNSDAIVRLGRVLT